MIVWPVLAKLDECGHWRAFALADSPHLGKRVRCVECHVKRYVVAAVDVATLVDLVDRLARLSPSDLSGILPPAG